MDIRPGEKRSEKPEKGDKNMAGITVVLDRKELVVRMEAETMRVDRPDCRLQRFPLAMIERVVVVGRPMVSCDVWRALAGRNIPALLLSGRRDGATAHIGPGLSASAAVRLAQFRAYENRNLTMTVCRWLLSEKLGGQERNLGEPGKGGAALDACRQQIKAANRSLHGAHGRNELMGLEGSAASAYFRAISQVVPEKWKFTGRNRRPPRDPVNALLSLSYTLGLSEVRREILRAGLDPAFGFLHALQSGRDSLALDLLEPLRPKIDRFVLDIIRDQLTLRDFSTNSQDGCRLNKSGREGFFQAWVRWLADAEGADAARLQSIIGQQMIPTLLAMIKADTGGPEVQATQDLE